MSQARSMTWDVRQKLSSRSMSLLRIVDSRRFQPVEDLFKNMDQLVNSRFLDISSYIMKKWDFPSSVWRFWNLQTLIVYNHKGVITAPTDFWHMPHIRHVEFDELRLPDSPNNQDDIVLRNLQKLGTVLEFKCSERVVKKIPNIRKLVFSYMGTLDGCLSNLDYLTKLESMEWNLSRRSAINFSCSLKRLVLNSIGSRYCWQDILDKVVVLPHFLKLTLLWGRFKEGKWETTEGQFRSLKFLNLVLCLSLEIWAAKSSHFPCLEHLGHDQADKLREIPLDFAEIATLREIVVDGCNDSVVVSAKRILEEHDDYYGEGALRKKNKAGVLDSPNFRVRR
ncbi:uncharacterized protein LOC131004104 [Salvia miltiorrhiza]|uniref:uncharacterized protein LOC131004104 n=1 Tax=Salvia miltiorrhiza TaxID=226208 RepID=UPI0025AD6687|nr:uncharacterized protein LOC131004104 [Salvia miltiorrhiza]